MLIMDNLYSRIERTLTNPGECILYQILRAPLTYFCPKCLNQIIKVPVDVLSVTNLCNNYEQYLIPDLIDDAVIPRANTIYILLGV